MMINLLICFAASRRTGLLTLEADTVRCMMWNGTPTIESCGETFVLDPRCMIIADTPRLNYNARHQPDLPKWAQEWLKCNPWWTWEAARQIAMTALENDNIADFRSLAVNEYRQVTVH